MAGEDGRASRRVENLLCHLACGGPKAACYRRRSCVAVLGAAGGIGQPLSLMMLTQLPALVHSLRLFDVSDAVRGVAADLGHCDAGCTVQAFVGEASLREALDGVDVVVIPAGVPRKPGMTRDDLFNINAGIVMNLIEAVADACPRALVAVITNPVNSTVPIAAEVLKKKGCYDPRRLFGVTALDVMRANRFLGDRIGMDPGMIEVPVIGGHAGATILPLFSQATPSCSLSQEEIGALTERTQNAGTEVVEAKAGKGSATLSMAAAAAQFVEKLLRGLAGEDGVTAYAYVSTSVTGVDVRPPSSSKTLEFFSSRVKLGREGITTPLPLGPLSAYERSGVEAMAAELAGSIKKGVGFVDSQR